MHYAVLLVFSQRFVTVKVLYWSHIHSVQCNLVSAFNPEEQWAATTPGDQLQTQSQYLGQGC